MDVADKMAKLLVRLYWVFCCVIFCGCMLILADALFPWSLERYPRLWPWLAEHAGREDQTESLFIAIGNSAHRKRAFHFLTNQLMRSDLDFYEMHGCVRGLVATAHPGLTNAFVDKLVSLAEKAREEGRQDVNVLQLAWALQTLSETNLGLAQDPYTTQGEAAGFSNYYGVFQAVQSIYGR